MLGIGLMNKLVHFCYLWFLILSVYFYAKTENAVYFLCIPVWVIAFMLDCFYKQWLSVYHLDVKAQNIIDENILKVKMRKQMENAFNINSIYTKDIDDGEA